MANIKDLKKKIKSTKGTLKITAAMKLVSAAKLSRAQIAISAARPFALELKNILYSISALNDSLTHPLMTPRVFSSEENTRNKKILLLVISSNKGLCGGLNAQIIKKAKAFCKEIQQQENQEHKIDLVCRFIGRKAKEALEKIYPSQGLCQFQKQDPSFKEIESLAKELAEQFLQGEYDEVFVAYNVFKSAITFIPTVQKILPLCLEEEEKQKFKEKFPFDFTYGPSPEKVLESLVLKSLISLMYTSLLDALASEHGSRMAAMDSASKNCKKAIRTLTIKMNKLRQSAITTELIEVVSGAESLKQ